jgi:hypothetical protein
MPLEASLMPLTPALSPQAAREPDLPLFPLSRQRERAGVRASNC